MLVPGVLGTRRLCDMPARPPIHRTARLGEIRRGSLDDDGRGLSTALSAGLLCVEVVSLLHADRRGGLGRGLNPVNWS